jgi:hypothetical protein
LAGAPSKQTGSAENNIFRHFSPIAQMAAISRQKAIAIEGL